MVSASLVDTAASATTRMGGHGARRRQTNGVLANSAHRREEMQRLVRLHRDIKGVTPDGIRYSGLNPEAWNWNLISIFFMHRGAFIALTGEQLDDTGDQAVWDRYRALTADLQMPGRARELPTSYAAAVRLLRSCCRRKAHPHRSFGHRHGRHTCTRGGPRTCRRSPRRCIRFWPIFGHIAAILGFGIMHPAVRDLVPMPWTRRHDIEISACSAGYCAGPTAAAAPHHRNTFGPQPPPVRAHRRPVSGCRTGVLRARRHPNLRSLSVVSRRADSYPARGTVRSRSVTMETLTAELFRFEPCYGSEGLHESDRRAELPSRGEPTPTVPGRRGVDADMRPIAGPSRRRYGF